MSDEHPTDLVEVSRSRTRAGAERHAFVLAAVGIDSYLITAEGGISLCVPAADAERARRELSSYERENRPAAPPHLPTRSLVDGLEAALVYCAVLLFFFGAARRDALGIDWGALGAAQAGLIVDGAWWRTLTALTLHADLGHLMSNLASGVVFGLLTAQLMGSGAAWLAILLAGALGNALNAVFQSEGHTAIGASTAIFGALGLLSGYMGRTRSVPWQGGIRRFAPLGGGIMLLVFLGFGGVRTDIWAHVLGFVAGGGLGYLLAPLVPALTRSPRAQRLSATLAGALLALAWLFALSG